MAVVRLLDPTVLRVVVDADDLVPATEELLDDVAADEAGRPADEHLLLLGGIGHRARSFPAARTVSSGSRGPNAKRYHLR